MILNLILNTNNIIKTYLIDISAMANRFVALLVVHHRSSLFAVRQGIAANANDQVHVREYVFRLNKTVISTNKFESTNLSATNLHQLSSMSLVKQIVYTVGVDAYPAWGFAWFRLSVCDASGVVDAFAFVDGVRFVAERCRFAYCLEEGKHN